MTDADLQKLHAALVDAVLDIRYGGNMQKDAWEFTSVNEEDLDSAKDIATTIQRISEGKETRPIAELWAELGLDD